ncbi:MAG: glycosyltransferase family 2 protein [Chloroflexi bacterium]|nr:glycosyltransferase family 2 protein [Chloroflexota bacterium]
MVIPAWKRPAPLRQALASVRAVQGTDLDIEIVVADNALLDETEQIAHEFGAVYLRNSAPGVAATRNAGAAVATGEFMAFLDDDDMWLPAHVRRHLDLLRADHSLGAVMGQIIPVDYSSLRPLQAPYPATLPADGDIFRVLLTGGLHIGGLVIRASAWDTVGPFDDSFNHGHTRVAVDDWDWYLRLAIQFRVGFVAEPCLLLRIHPPSRDEDTNTYLMERVGREVFWTNVRRAGRRRPSLIWATRTWLRHDGMCAGRLLWNASEYVAQKEYKAACQALLLAARTSPLHTALTFARAGWMRG